MGTERITFDSSIARFVEVVDSVVGDSWRKDEAAAILRDASGLLTLVILSSDLILHREKIEAAIRSLDAYVDANNAVLTPEEMFDPSLRDLKIHGRINHGIEPRLEAGSISEIPFLDRRVVGADWLSSPRPPINGGSVPIFVFASIKGGVGRSTSLSIVARDLAEQGLRVLAVDLDLEAPGLGSMLLTPQTRPKFGTLDFFVERGQSAFDEVDFVNLLEASDVASANAPVYVAPAFGRLSLDFPSNVLAKISRAYIEDIDSYGNTKGLLDRTRDLIAGLMSVRDFDVILVDGRAGLHETLASSILGLGADILMFGVNEPQTFEGYTPLLMSLREAVRNNPDFLLKLHVVQAKADGDNPTDTVSFRDKSHSLFAQTLYEAPPDSSDQLDGDNVSWFAVDDSDGPHYPWIVNDSRLYRAFDPQTRIDQLERRTFADPYGDLISKIHDILGLGEYQR